MSSLSSFCSRRHCRTRKSLYTLRPSFLQKSPIVEREPALVWLITDRCQLSLPLSFRLAVLRYCLLVGCLTSQQHASVSQGRICSDNFTCCHTEKEVADPTFYLTQSQYADTGPTSPRADPITPGAWQGSHWSVNF